MSMKRKKTRMMMIGVGEGIVGGCLVRERCQGTEWAVIEWWVEFRIWIGEWGCRYLENVLAKGRCRVVEDLQLWVQI